MERNFGFVIPKPSFLEMGQLRPFVLPNIYWVTNTIHLILIHLYNNSLYSKCFANSFKLNLYYFFYIYRWRNCSDLAKITLLGGGKLEPTMADSKINTVFVATYTIIVKGFIFCHVVWINSLREWGSTSLRDNTSGRKDQKRKQTAKK